MSYILLIEDNQANADMANRALTAAGFEVQHHLRGLDGARTARVKRPSLILLDFDLPDIDGKALILTLKRQLGGIHSPPIVAFTAQIGRAEKQLAARFGCKAFVGKPFDPQQLVELVNELVHQPQ
jgi:DNA-binding response OmpR family regulator